MPNSNGPRKKTRKKLRNNPRESGRSPPQRAVAEYETGQKVHLKIDPSVPEGRYHPRFDGYTGEIVGTQGSAYKVSITEDTTEKTLIVKAAHLTAQE